MSEQPLPWRIWRTGTAHLTMVEAHPYHQPVGPHDHKGAGWYQHAENMACPLCRMTKEEPKGPAPTQWRTEETNT